MLHLISPPMRFDFQSNLQYKVFNLQSHCIFVVLLGYGALAALLYLHEMVPEIDRARRARSAWACRRCACRCCRSGATSTTATRPAIGSAINSVMTS